MSADRISAEWVEKAARVLWLSDDYDLDSDPKSSTARELRPEYIRRARDILAAVIDDIRATERERVAVAIEETAHPQGWDTVARQNFYGGIVVAASIARADEATNHDTTEAS